ncbi:quinone oxidoreductase family protein [Rhizohabitans arisaemae]|uniref:quinone oxidoreductase family protein n=1 Tax=Rhizohabitans arisaemae TaxID=2720610 RepID=UPI0024B2778E|nr:quinone oxidoreductase [Rhizohabitans arisaemae]
MTDSVNGGPQRVTMAVHGPPEVLRVVDAEVAEPGAGEVLVRVTAAGVNYVDLFQRSGTYTVKFPFTPGFEGAGVVERVGPAVTGIVEGDRIAWAGSPGGYATHCVVKADKTVPLPDGMDPVVAVAALIHGMTAHVLATDVVPLAAGDVCLVHAAAGGVGGLLTQYATARGATVIATVSNEEKAEAARTAGAAHVVDYTREDFAARVKEITDGAGVAVVYDAVGEATFTAGLGCLRPRGTFVLYGQTSGAVRSADPQELGARGSLFLTKASLGHYDRTREQMLRRAGTVFGDVLAGRLRPRIHAEYPLAEAALAHADLESRRSIGKAVLRPGR